MSEDRKADYNKILARFMIFIAVIILIIMTAVFASFVTLNDYREQEEIKKSLEIEEN
ncbi:MAG: hypothetical protein ACK5LV_05455 [Lachnospirales bacterium]